MSLSRRNLLIGAASLAAAGPVHALSQKMQNRELVLGSGSSRYLWVGDWLDIPDDYRLGDTHGVAQDSRGHIYLAHTVHPSSKSKDAILVFDEAGRFLRSWGDRFQGGAHGLDLRKEGEHEYLYHCDVAHRVVVKTKLDGTVVWEKSTPPEFGEYASKNLPYIPTNVAFGDHGEFYVADGYGSNWIHRYDLAGNYLQTFGGPGSEPGKVQQPHGQGSTTPWSLGGPARPQAASCRRRSRQPPDPILLARRKAPFVREERDAPSVPLFDSEREDAGARPRECYHDPG